MEAAFRSRSLFMLLLVTGKIGFGTSTRSERGTVRWYLRVSALSALALEAVYRVHEASHAFIPTDFEFGL